MKKVTQVLAVLATAFLLVGCNPFKSDMTLAEKAEAALGAMESTCNLAINYELVVKMLASSQAGAMTAAEVGYSVCKSYVASRTPSAMATLKSSDCPHGEAFGECIEPE